MNYLTRKWSQVQNDRKNAMSIDTSKLTTNVLRNPDLFTIVQKKALWFFYRDGTAYYEVRLTPPCFPSRNITKNAETYPPHVRDVIIEQPLKLCTPK